MKFLICIALLVGYLTVPVMAESEHVLLKGRITNSSSDTVYRWTMICGISCLRPAEEVLDQYKTENSVYNSKSLEKSDFSLIPFEEGFGEL